MEEAEVLLKIDKVFKKVLNFLEWKKQLGLKIGSRFIPTGNFSVANCSLVAGQTDPLTQ